MNNKYCGNIADFFPVVEDTSRVVISHGLQVAENGEDATWYEVVFYKKQGKPTIEQIKKAVIDDINAHTKAKIVGGFVWNGINVWLSEENQHNISEAQRLGIVPSKFKLGENEDGTPIYHTFETTEELQEFELAMTQYIKSCLEAGWEEKDGMDWTPYENYLNPQETSKKTKKK